MTDDYIEDMKCGRCKENKAQKEDNRLYYRTLCKSCIDEGWRVNYILRTGWRELCGHYNIHHNHKRYIDGIGCCRNIRRNK